MPPAIIVGLGNPGSEYEFTRHNVGFRVVDELCRRFRKVPKAGQGSFFVAQTTVGGKDVVLLKPTTYMNNSGEAVADILQRTGSLLTDVVIVVDDFWLSLGTIRVRAKGSDGGHNGLASIIYQLNSNEFARIRCGIKKEVMPPKDEMAGFVLSPFERDETPMVGDMIGRAADAATEFVVSGIARAMNRFNR